VSIVLLLAAILGGVAATYFVDEDARLPARLAMGVPLGIVAWGLVGYLLGWAFGLSMGTVTLAAVIVLAAPLWILRSRRRVSAIREDLAYARWDTGRAIWNPSRGVVVTVLFYVFMLVLVTRILNRAIFEAPEGGGVFTGVDHNLGDLPFHLSIATSFLYGRNFPPEHPELAGARLTYPFVIDLVAAMLMAAGATARRAFQLENLVLGWALVGLLHRFALRLTQNRLAALLVPCLVIASGGLGFLWLARDVDPAADGLMGLLRRPTHDYTILPPGPLRWGNLAVTMLVPQRSFLLGLPLFLIVATLWWQAVTDEDRARAHRRLLAAGAITGIMPLAHAHAFTMAMGIGIALALLFPDLRAWSRSLGLAAGLAVPQVLLLATGSEVQSRQFLGWQVGWDRGHLGLVHFWWLNLGFFIPALIAAVLWRGRKPVVADRLLRFYAPFALCFLVPNLVRLSPWIWDNIKFMVWWHITSAVLIALLLSRLWRLGGWARATSAALFVFLTLSGGLDLWRAASDKIVLPVIPPEGEAFAADIRAKTPPRAMILHAPTYNSEVYLTGRRTVFGYPGHVWSQGLDAGTREEDLKKMYGGHPEAREHLARYEVDFLVVGPREKAMDGFDEDSRRAFDLVVERGPYRLYRVR
jgi:hypothetical protein